VAVPAEGDVLDTPEAGQRILRGGAVRFVGFGLGTLVSVVGVALVTRHLGRADYGRFSTVVSLVTVVQVITDVGMSTLAVREYAQRRDASRERVLALILGLRVALTGVGVTLAVLLGVLFGYDGQMLLGAVLTGVGLLALVLQGTYAVPLSAEIRMVPVTLLDVGRQLMLTLAYVGLVLAGAGIVPFLAATVPVHVALLAMTVPLVRGKVSLRPRMELRAWGELLRPTLTFSLATAVGMIYSYTALIVCGLVTSADETGLFAAAFRVFIILIVIPGLLVTTAFPLLARTSLSDRARFDYALLRLNEVGALVGGATAVGTVLAAPAIIQVIAGPSYDGGIPALRVLGLALALSFVVAPWGYALLAGEDQRPLLRGNALAFVLSAATVALVAPGLGAEGAAFGTLVGEASLALTYAYGLRRGRQPLQALSPRSLRCLPGLALGLAVLLLGLPAVPAAVLGLVVYAASALALRAAPPELGDLLPAPLKRLVA
jgi:O-antigen/teichoic acid export membrane protein